MKQKKLSDSCPFKPQDVIATTRWNQIQKFKSKIRNINWYNKIYNVQWKQGSPKDGYTPAVVFL